MDKQHKLLNVFSISTYKLYILSAFIFGHLEIIARVLKFFLIGRIIKLKSSTPTVLEWILLVGCVILGPVFGFLCCLLCGKLAIQLRSNVSKLLFSLLIRSDKMIPSLKAQTLLSILSTDVYKYEQLGLNVIFIPLKSIEIVYWIVVIVLDHGFLLGLLSLIPVVIFSIKFLVMRLGTVEVRLQMAERRDALVKRLDEFLNGFYLIKAHGWETQFVHWLCKSRSEYCGLLQRELLYNCAPMINILVYSSQVILLYLCIKETIDGALSTSNLGSWIIGITQIGAALSGKFLKGFQAIEDVRIAQRRIAKFVEMINSYEGTRFASNTSLFHATSSDIDFDEFLTEIEGKFSVIVGPTGVGKSVFIEQLIKHACLNNLTLAVSLETEWMIEASIKENILLGASEDEPQLRRILKACSLWDEFTVLPGSLDYNVGYEGGNISGGQRQRLSIARMLYHSHQYNLFVFDRFLHGINNELSMELFATLRELLSEKTVLLVTNNRNIIEQCDLKITISSEQSGYSIERIGDGRRFYSIRSAEERESEELEGLELEEKELEGKELDKRELDKQHYDKRESDKQHSDKQESSKQHFDKRESSKQKYDIGGLEDEIFEDFNQSTDAKALLEKLPKSSIHPLRHVFPLSFILSFIMVVGLLTAIPEYLKVIQIGYFNNWTTQSIIPYSLLFFGILACCIVKCFLMSRVCFVVSRRLFQKLIEKIFQTVECSLVRGTIGNGLLLNRISKDQIMIDEYLTDMLNELSQCIFSLIRRIFLVMLVPKVPFRYIAIFVIALTVVAFELSRFIFIRKSTVIKGKENQLRELLLSFTKSTICSTTGIISIKAFSMHTYVEETFVSLVGQFLNASFSFIVLSNALILAIDLFCGLYLGLIFYAKAERPSDIVVLQQLAMDSSSFLQWMLLCSVQWEEFRSAFIRIGAILDMPEEEGGKAGKSGEREGLAGRRELTFSKDERVERSSNSQSPIPDSIQKSVVEDDSGFNLPSYLEMNHVSYKHNSKSPLVFSDVSLTIHKNEHFVLLKGRSGSGKSTIFSILLRMNPPSNQSGTIFVLSRNQLDYPIDEYRALFAYIPQSPTIFKTLTLRQNIDPISTRTDQELHQLLNTMQCTTLLHARSLGLDSLVEVEKFSLSDLCRLGMVRALCRSDAKFLLVDETIDAFDDEMGKRLVEDLLAACKERVVIMITHFDRFDSHFDRHYELRGGTLQ